MSPLTIDPCSTAHRVLLALRPGTPTEQARISDRVGAGAYAVLTHLNRAGYIERTADGGSKGSACYWRITGSGRAACPDRRGNFADYHDFSVTTLGDL